MFVPTIDLKAAEKDVTILSPLDAACRDHGFFLLRNHGMDDAIEQMWRAASAFFDQPSEVKREVLRTESIPLGYYDRELTKRKRDLKEVFDYMQPRADGSDRNQWPAGQSEFFDAMNRFFTEASSVAERTLRLVYRALAGDGISQLATPEGDPRTSTVRLNYYPVADPLSGDEQLAVAGLGDMALHHHTDPGVLTLLLQDMTGGLQTLSKEDGWIDVTPEESTIVVNLGDSLQVWSNDNYRAAIHRVVPMTTLKNGSDGRFSTPYFYNPKGDAMLEPLSALSADTPLYRPFTWREYIKGRVDDNYTDLGEEDIQIAQYRV
ncbi:MAG: 2OG-Fe(II) oxygenase family protein [Pseudomonadales bacterium]|tara:strand:+ start:11279 stop:12238 length:960 start_codon:yes stop_codon:yes gene_type:complete